VIEALEATTGKPLWHSETGALTAHAHLRTTAGYLHLSDSAVRSTKSPLERLDSIDLIRSSVPKKP
jgi:hypothetical protein